MERIVHSVYAEITPNPSTVKYVSDHRICELPGEFEFDSINEAKGISPLAEELFALPFVDAVYLANNFVTVTKTDNVDWDFINMELREFIRNYLNQGKPVVQKEQEAKPKKTKIDISQFSASDLDDQIKALLDEYVAPAVESDGGAINFIAYQEGKVFVELKGSCNGCPSSEATLKGGIETLLKNHLEGIEEVVAVN
ncbi:MAG: NifU family protein [Crocinitomicaceae bacterium]|nr:NifU family protein [Crocinitomicaceae bacterium]